MSPFSGAARAGGLARAGKAKRKQQSFLPPSWFRQEPGDGQWTREMTRSGEGATTKPG